MHTLDAEAARDPDELAHARPTLAQGPRLNTW